MGKVPQQLDHEQLVATYVKSGCSLAIGGLHFHNTPMVLVREVIRQEIKIDRLVPPIDGSINADLLIGAGLVSSVQVAYLGLEIFGLANRFRAAAECGKIEVRDMEEAGFALAMVAGSQGQPFASLPKGFFPKECERPRVVDVNKVDYAEVMDPFTGELNWVVKALRADVSMIHCQVIDRDGNCGFLGGEFLDAETARIGDACIVQAERLVDELPKACRAHIPSYIVDAFCVLEGGAHPASSHGCYGYDEDHLRRYADLSATEEGFQRYVNEVIGKSEADYRRKAAVGDWLAAETER